MTLYALAVSAYGNEMAASEYAILSYIRSVSGMTVDVYPDGRIIFRVGSHPIPDGADVQYYFDRTTDMVDVVESDRYLPSIFERHI